MTESKKNIQLETSDTKIIDISVDHAMQSKTLKNMIEDLGEIQGPIPVPNVSYDTMSLVIKYLDRHQTHPEAYDKVSSKEERIKLLEEKISTWDYDYCTKIDTKTLFDIILAANYLNIQPLLDLTCHGIASLIKNQSIEDIRKLFKIENDFTKEDMEKIQKENAWIEEE